MPDPPSADALPPELQAALDAWEQLAGFAWQQVQTKGRGMVLVDRRDLLQRAGDTDPIPLSYIPLGYIPATDDFRPLVNDYDPARQVVLMIGQDYGDEQVMVLEADGKTRQPPSEV